MPLTWPQPERKKGTVLESRVHEVLRFRETQSIQNYINEC